MIDISLVLNIHRESTYLTPTLNSLNSAVRFAQNAGLKVELIAVFDNSDKLTKDNLLNSNLEAFNNFQFAEVDVKSLGLAKNIGIEMATGKYVFTAEADDLISRNSIKELFVQAEKNNNNANCAYFLEYKISFGERYFVAKFQNSQSLSTADFIAHSMFTSGIFARKELLQKFHFRDIPIESGFGFEDWDLHNRLFASGVEFFVAKNTILFSRTQVDDPLNHYPENSTKLVARSEIHQASHLLEKLSQNKVKDKVHVENPSTNLASYITSSKTLTEFILETIDIEPSILIDLIKNAMDRSPLSVDETHWAKCFISLINILQGETFSDIVLLQNLNQGGAEKYILQILDSIIEIKQDANVLILTLEDTEQHSWRNQINNQYKFIDLRNMFPFITNEQFECLLITSLLSLGTKGSRLHFKTSIFNQHFFLNYKKVICEKFEPIYYRFSDAVYYLDDRQFRDGHITKFLQELIQNISRIITDNQFIIDEDKKILGSSYQDKYFKINSIIENKDLALWKSHDVNYKILWASRFAFEKRPDILIDIIKLLRDKNPQFQIDIYGKNTMPDLMDQIAGVEGLNYCGEFSEFGQIPINNYDLLLYTSRFEGASLIILESISAGLPVIGPKVGGIPESISAENYLIENNSNTLELAKSYVYLVLRIYSNFQNVTKQFEKLSAKTREKHSKNIHLHSVARVFNLADGID